jgi:hypothetical protein
VPHPKPIQVKTEEEKQQYFRDYQKSNRGKMNSYREAWKAKNREYFEAQAAAYYEANKDRIRERDKARRKAEKETAKTRWRSERLAKKARRDAGWRKEAPAIQVAVTECLESYRIGNQYWDVYESQLIDNPTIDHIVPVTAAGTHTADNFCITSLENNASKGNRSLLVWLAKRARRFAAAAKSSGTRGRKATSPEKSARSNLPRERPVP